MHRRVHLPQRVPYRTEPWPLYWGTYRYSPSLQLISHDRLWRMYKDDAILWWSRISAILWQYVLSRAAVFKAKRQKGKQPEGESFGVNLLLNRFLSGKHSSWLYSHVSAAIPGTRQDLGNGSELKSYNAEEQMRFLFPPRPRRQQRRRRV